MVGKRNKLLAPRFLIRIGSNYITDDRIFNHVGEAVCTDQNPIILHKFYLKEVCLHIFGSPDCPGDNIFIRVHSRLAGK